MADGLYPLRAIAQRCDRPGAADVEDGSDGQAVASTIQQWCAPFAAQLPAQLPAHVRHGVDEKSAAVGPGLRAKPGSPTEIPLSRPFPLFYEPA